MQSALRTTTLIVAALTILTGQQALAAPFEPVFRVGGIVGDVRIQRPGDSTFRPASNDKTYPYGTAVRTGINGRVTITFSLDNVCRLDRNGKATITEDPDDASIKIVRLETGKVDISLAKGFDETNGLHIETPTATAEALGGKLEIEILEETELRVAGFSCEKEGSMRVFNRTLCSPFETSPMQEGDAISVAGSKDLTFVRVKDVDGEYTFSFLDDTGAMRETPMAPGSVTKIWCRRVAETGADVVTVLLVASDGTLIEAVNFSVQPPAAPVAPDAEEIASAPNAPPAAPAAAPQPEPKQDTEEDTEEDPAPGPTKDDGDDGPLDDDDFFAMSSGLGLTISDSLTTTADSFTPIGKR